MTKITINADSISIKIVKLTKTEVVLVPTLLDKEGKTIYTFEKQSLSAGCTMNVSAKFPIEFTIKDGAD
jgi:predicted lipoprotein with Yx(FWY)xxD motif